MVSAIKQTQKAMNKYPINSINIKSVWYYEEDKILEIEFKLNIIHQYLGVSFFDFVAFMKSENKEEYFLNYIQYKYHFDVFSL